MKLSNKLSMITLMIIFSSTFCIDEDFKVIKLSHFEDDDSYLPVKPGTKFIIEAEGNPSTGYSWYLERPERLKSQRILKALNLNEHNIGDYYRHHDEEVARMVGLSGIYHFKFEADNQNVGMEKLEFVYRRGLEGEPAHKVTVNVNVVRPHSDL